MRITNSHRGHTTNLAKCTKMTEGEHRIHGMNGVTDSGTAAVKEEGPQTSDTYNLGGRLKFFKNGRFILELARAREGEKGGWVPVPKKTFWPPQGSASSVSTYRQESSTSLSVSDDNSSVQSSPWQRDHTWKQTTPRRNVSNHLTFSYYRPKHLKQQQQVRSDPHHRCWRYRLQRAPLSQRTKSGAVTAVPNSKCNNLKCQVMNQQQQQTHNVNQPSAMRSRSSLVHIVQVLWNKSLHAFNSITSPRKRILRELERVTIDDLSFNKRCRSKNAALPVKNTNTTTTTSGASSSSADVVNGNGAVASSPDDHQHQQRTTVVVVAPSPAASKNCSYSITSLLSSGSRERERERDRDSRERDEKLSSQYVVPVSRMTSTHDSIVANQTSTPTTNSTAATAVSYAAHDTCDGPIRSAQDIMVNKRSPLSSIPRGSPSLPNSSGDHYSPHHPASHSQQQPPPPPPPPHHSYPPYMSPYAVYPVLGHHTYMNPYYSAAATATYGARSSYYPAALVPPPPPPPAAPSLSRHHSSYAWPVSAAAPAPYEHGLHRDESDVPLNLSKHAD